MTQTTAETTYLLIRCARCGESIQQSVAWLISKDNMTCKGCSGAIDLKSAETQLLIKEAAKHCARTDAELSKIV